MKDAITSLWPITRLGDLIELISGQHIAAKDYNSEGRGIPYLTGPSDFGPLHPNITRWTEHPKKRAIAGDILITVKGSGVGKVNMLDIDELVISRQIMAVRPRRINPRFLYLFLENCFDHFQAAASGAAIPGLSREDVLELSIPLPPLEEQRRMVAILDEAFEGLDRARAHAEANLECARDLFDAAVTECFLKAGENAETKTTLGNLATFRNGLNFTRSSKGRAVKIVGVGDFKNHNTVPIDRLSEITIDGELADADCLRPGDLLSVRSNGNRELIGRTMLVPHINEDLSFSGFTIRIRLSTDRLLPEYLCEFMRTKAARRTMIEGGGGANISNLNQKILSDIQVAFPDLKHQQSILDELSQVRSDSSKLAAAYQTKLQDLEDLRQSLLQRAFSGELTAKEFA